LPALRPAPPVTMRIALYALLGSCLALGTEALTGKPKWEPPIVSRCKCGAGPPSESPEFKEAREVRKLSDEIEDAERILKGEKLKLENAAEYHMKRKKMQKQQMEIKKRAPSAKVVAHDEDYYTSHMCAMLVSARIMKDDDAKKRVMDLCLDREELALTSETETIGVARPPCDCGGASFLARRPEGPEGLKKQLQKLKDEIKKAKADYETKPEEWRQELLDGDDTLGDFDEKLADDYEAKTKSQKDNWAKVQKKMCDMIHGGADTDTLLKSCPKK